MLTNLKKTLALIFYPVGMLVLPLVISLIIVIIRGYELSLDAGSDFINANIIAAGISYGILCLALLIVTFNVFRKDWGEIKSWSKLCLQMLIGILCTFVMSFFGNWLVTLFGTTEIAMNQQLAQDSLSAFPVLMILTVVVFGPVVEEIVFRLVLMNLFKWKPVYNIIFSGFIFGLMHVLVGGLIHIIPYFLMGLVFGIYYDRFKNIWHVTILHILHNGLAVGLFFLYQTLY